jgi:hypothetical protein
MLTDTIILPVSICGVTHVTVVDVRKSAGRICCPKRQVKFLESKKFVPTTVALSDPFHSPIAGRTSAIVAGEKYRKAISVEAYSVTSARQATLTCPSCIELGTLHEA